MHILALEPYFGGSHKAFLNGWMKHSKHQFSTVTMADRFWKWRMQGGAVTLAKKALQTAAEEGMPDAIFSTSMVNLPAFLALTRQKFAHLPVVHFFHENQLTYPEPQDVKRDLTYGYINYLSGLAADKVVFNSQFHYNEFFDALPDLLRNFPDYTHLEQVHEMKQKSEVIHLGLDLELFDKYASEKTSLKNDLPIILWNQRWEWDKNPSAFFRVMNRLDDVGCKFRLILAGERFEQQPPEFDLAFQRYADRILHYGYVESREEYAKLLQRADIVVATAHHEFFGISMMESIYAGCHPLAPHRLTYPELIPKTLHQPLLHAPILYKDEDNLFEILRNILKGAEQPLPKKTLQEIVAPLDWRTHVKAFDGLMESLAVH